MTPANRHQHWDTIYQTKRPDQVSWYEPTPVTSLALLERFGVTPTARLIDVGGGDSHLVDHLLARGFRQLTVLDISATALARAQARLAKQARAVTWIATDVTAFRPTDLYDIWHDRAAFHFLTERADVARYVATARQALVPGGWLVIGTFSEQGPTKCSGIAIQQYSETTLTEVWRDGFRKEVCVTADHPTPFGTVQNFIFGVFRRI